MELIMLMMADSHYTWIILCKKMNCDYNLFTNNESAGSQTRYIYVWIN